MEMPSRVFDENVQLIIVLLFALLMEMPSRVFDENVQLIIVLFSESSVTMIPF